MSRAGNRFVVDFGEVDLPPGKAEELDRELRAVALRSLGNLDVRPFRRFSILMPPETWGIVVNQPTDVFGLSEDSIGGPRSGPSIGLAPLRTGKPLSQEAVAGLNEQLAMDPDIGRRFVAALANDFSGAMSDLFELSAEQFRQTIVTGREDRDLLEALMKQYEDARRLGSATVVLSAVQVDPSERAEEKRGSIKVEGGIKKNPKGELEQHVTLTIEWKF